MARKKHSIMKATMFITLIITLNLMGISYAHWQDSLTSSLRVHTGYIEPSFEAVQEISWSGGLNSLEYIDDDKNIEIIGVIKNGEEGEFQLFYTVVNNGSLPIKFDNKSFGDSIKEEIGLEILEKPSSSIIYPGNKASEKIIGKIKAPKVKAPNEDNSQENMRQEYAPLEDVPEEAASEEAAPLVVGNFEFNIVLPYKLWVD